MVRRGLPQPPRAVSGSARGAIPGLAVEPAGREADGADSRQARRRTAVAHRGGVGPGGGPRPGRRRLRHRHRHHRPRAARGHRRGGRRARRPGPDHRHRRRRPVRHRGPPDRRLRPDVHPARLPDRRARRRGGGSGGHGGRRRRDGGRARRAGGRPRQPRPAAVGHRVAGAHRRHPLRGRHEPGGHHPRLPAPQPDPLVQRRHPPHQRRRDPRQARQPAQPLARPHPHPRERQAAPPLVGHRLVRRGDGRRAGAGHLDHPVDRPAAGRGAARRGVGPVRLGRHRRRHQLPAEGRRGRGQPRAEHRHLPRRRRRLVQLRRQRRPAPRRDRLRQPQPRVRQREPDRPQRAAPRRGRSHRRRQHPRARPRPGLGQPPHRGRPEALRQLRPPVRQPGAALRLRQLRRQEGHRGLLLPQPQLAAEHLQPRRGRDPAHRRRAAGPRHGLGQLPRGAGHRQRARPRRPRPGLRRPRLLLVPGDGAGRVHPAVRRLRHRRLGGGRRAAHRRQRLHVGRQCQLRRPRVGLLLPQHRQRVARPRHVRATSTPASTGRRTSTSTSTSPTPSPTG